MSKVLVVYHSFTGKCQKLAEAAAEGARSAGSDAVVKDAAAVTAADPSAADAVIIGTPQPFGSVAGETKKPFERLWPEREKVGTGKPLGAFVCRGNVDTAGSFEFLRSGADASGWSERASG
ncbi:MAG: flavodoxin domain-containing protein [Dehalococcoidia bacterium]|jgi:multimeric flavodoxin WrbA|nr:flavodoxin domain-containing protein [Dehalococcoidia bacterium]MDP6782248.1 flavodoxin domain-containing protein [Dehalococcoidia bacterium]